VKGIAFAHGNEATALDGYAAPTCALGHGSASSTLVAFDGFPLWAVGARLSPQTELAWKAGHGDEAVYVASGELQIAGRTCPAGGAVVVEAGFEARLSSAGGASVLHFGPWDPEPPSEGRYGAPALGRRAVHVVGPGGTYAATEPGRDTRMFADSSCETCRITLFFTGRAGTYISPMHSHSVDELIWVLGGEVRFGSRRLHAGDAVAIEARHRYGFRSGAEGFAVLNYRRDASEQTADDGVPRPEGGIARGLTLVNDVR
jgi:mannose-6-phosphate isomerase-like protein (cupin superfamily)/uncharacterized Zn-binding protein involved in type VI secretion